MMLSCPRKLADLLIARNSKRYSVYLDALIVLDGRDAAWTAHDRQLRGSRTQITRWLFLPRTIWVLMTGQAGCISVVRSLQARNREQTVGNSYAYAATMDSRGMEDHGSGYQLAIFCHADIRSARDAMGLYSQSRKLAEMGSTPIINQHQRQVILYDIYCLMLWS